MNDLEKHPVPVRTLEKQGLASIANLAGGLFLLALGFIGGRFPIVGIILGVITGICGCVTLFSKDPADRKPGAILAAGGILAVLSRVGAAFFRPFAGTLLSIGAFGLIALGIWNGIKFLKGLKSRS
jgi:multisubunit Na+/H+ antiporter MnhB subunit